MPGEPSVSAIQTTTERLVSVAEGSRQSGIPYGRLRGLIRRGKVPVVKVGDVVMLRPSALKAAIEER